MPGRVGRTVRARVTGAFDWNRTNDTCRFKAVLYRLSYEGVESISAVSAREPRRRQQCSLHTRVATQMHMHTRPAQCLCTGTPDMERTKGLEPFTSALARQRSTN